jgi:hypothetical protein
MDDTTRNMVDLRNEIEHLTADNERLREQLAECKSLLRQASNTYVLPDDWYKRVKEVCR